MKLRVLFGIGALLVVFVSGESAAPVPRPFQSRVSSTAISDEDLSIAYSVEQWVPGKRDFEKVDPQKTFRKGDEIVVKIEPTADAFLYVLNKDLTGAWQAILPSPDRPEEGNRLTARQALRIPAEDHLVFRNDGPGEETLFLVLSRKRQRIFSVAKQVMPRNGIREPGASRPDRQSPERIQNQVVASPRSEPETATADSKPRSNPPHRNFFQKVFGLEGKAPAINSPAKDGVTQTGKQVRITQQAVGAQNSQVDQTAVRAFCRRFSSSETRFRRL